VIPAVGKKNCTAKIFVLLLTKLFRLIFLISETRLKNNIVYDTLYLIKQY
jgi:hypothetical protein